MKLPSYLQPRPGIASHTLVKCGLFLVLLPISICFIGAAMHPRWGPLVLGLFLVLAECCVIGAYWHENRASVARIKFLYQIRLRLRRLNALTDPLGEGWHKTPKGSVALSHRLGYWVMIRFSQEELNDTFRANTSRSGEVPAEIFILGQALTAQHGTIPLRADWEIDEDTNQAGARITARIPTSLDSLNVAEQTALSRSMLMDTGELEVLLGDLQQLGRVIDAGPSDSD